MAKLQIISKPDPVPDLTTDGEHAIAGKQPPESSTTAWKGDTSTTASLRRSVTECASLRLDQVKSEKSINAADEKKEGFSLGYIKTEMMSGLIVVCGQIPASCAYAQLANLDPAQGLMTAWIIGVVVALFRGRAGSINGSTAAMGAAISAYVTKDGEGAEVMFLGVMATSIWFFLFAKLRVGQLLQLVPTTVMLGFSNGLGTVIGMAQLRPFQREGIDAAELGSMLLLCVLSMLIIEFFPRLTKSVPPAAVAILVTTALEHLLLREVGAGTYTIGDSVPFSIEKALPRPFFLNDTYDMSKITEMQFGELVWKVLQMSLMLTLGSAIESLMTLQVLGSMTATKGFPERHLYGLGVGNLLAGFFGGMGGNTLSSLSLMNTRCGGRGMTSQLTAALGVLITLVGAYPALNLIPLATLSGVMLMVVIKMIKWFSLKLMTCSLLPEKAATRWPWIKKNRIKTSDAVVILVVTFMIVAVSLPVGFLVGVALSNILYAWDSLHHIQVVTAFDEQSNKKIYEVNGPLFFGACSKFEKCFNVNEDPDEVEIHFQNAALFDYSAMETLNNLIAKYKTADKTVRLKAMTEGSVQLVREHGQTHMHILRSEPAEEFQVQSVHHWHDRESDPTADQATPDQVLAGTVSQSVKRFQSSVKKVQRVSALARMSTASAPAKMTNKSDVTGSTPLAAGIAAAFASNQAATPPTLNPSTVPVKSSPHVPARES